MAQDVSTIDFPFQVDQVDPYLKSLGETTSILVVFLGRGNDWITSETGEEWWVEPSKNGFFAAGNGDGEKT